MLKFGHYLKRIREAKGVTQEQLALACGFPNQSRISNYENHTRKPRLPDILKIAAELQCGIGELFGETAANDDQDWDNVLGYAQAVGLGDGEEAQEWAETHKLKFRAESLARQRLRPSSLAIMYGKGDSMLPRIQPGDAIMFDMADTRPMDEYLFVICCPGINGTEYSVKRCRMFGDDVYFDALNPAGDHNWRKPRKMDDERHPISILGRVRWIGSWENRPWS